MLMPTNVCYLLMSLLVQIAAPVDSQCPLLTFPTANDSADSLLSAAEPADCQHPLLTLPTANDSADSLLSAAPLSTLSVPADPPDG